MSDLNPEEEMQSYYQNPRMTAESEEATILSVDRSIYSNSKLFVICLCGLLFFVVAVSWQQNFDGTITSIVQKEFSTKHTKKSESMEIEVLATSPDYGSLASLPYLPWDVVIEPYKDYHITLESAIIGDKEMIEHIKKNNDGYYAISWELNDENYSGYKIKINVPSVGVLNGTVKVSDSSTDKTYTSTFTAAVKYVRRELRTLTDEDRETFFNTLELLYSTEQKEGKKLYGDKFVNAEFLLYRHLYGAARSDCDHWHDGAGFPMLHTALTLEAEQALQSIDPSLSMPYWEYAMDNYLYDDYSESPIFGDDWFGSSSPSSDRHFITAGRWRGLELPDGSSYEDDWDVVSTGSLNPFVNARGQMRSPWNNNPSSKIGRFNMTYDKDPGTIPDCSHMRGCYDSTSYKKMANCLNGATHGPVHIKIGGAWDGGNVTDDDDLQFLDGIDRSLFFKMIWRSGFTRCPTSCGKDEECKCSIPEPYWKSVGWYKMLVQSGVWDAGKLSKRYSLDMETLYPRILKAIADPGVIGDMFSSGASYDPSFWPVHGQLERLLGLKRVRLARNETVFDETWGYATGTDALYMMGRCDWSNVKSIDDLTLPTCDHSVDNICPGHNEFDVMEFGNFLGNGETYTNRGFYDFIHPWNDQLPYTYDAFDFEYCSSYNYTF